MRRAGGAHDHVRDERPARLRRWLVAIGAAAFFSWSQAGPAAALEPAEPDIVVIKSGPAACSATGCRFETILLNAGSRAIEGPVTVRETFGPGVESVEQPGEGWTCETEGGGRLCRNPALILAPGETSGYALLARGSGAIVNCAKTDALPGETATHDNRDCATAYAALPESDEPAPSVSMDCGMASDGRVRCRVGIESGSSVRADGLMVTLSARGDGGSTKITSLTPDGPAWSCDPASGASSSCTLDDPAAASHHVDATFSSAPDGAVAYCARAILPAGGARMHARVVAESCDDAAMPLTVGLSGEPECKAGAPCTFTLTLTNGAKAAFAGSMRVAYAIGLDGSGRLEDVALEIEPPLGCDEAPSTAPFACDASLVLAAGASRTHRLTVVLPEAAAGATGQACAAALDPDAVAAAIIGGGDTAAGAPAAVASGPFACHDFGVPAPERAVVAPAPKKSREAAPRAGQGGDDAACRLLPGQIRTKAGECVCPRGTRLERGRCRQQVAECGSGQKLVKGRCVTEPKPVACKRGQRIRNGKCVDVQSTRCPAGTTGKPPNCRPLGVNIPGLILQQGILKGGTDRPRAGGNRRPVQ